MNEQWCGLVQDCLEDIRAEVKALRIDLALDAKEAHKRQMRCMARFASKSYVRTMFYLTILLVLIAVYHPDALADIISGLKGAIK